MRSSSHYFIALALPASLRKSLHNWQEELKKHAPYKQWPHPDDLHITLKFLGPVEQFLLMKLEKELESIETLPSFHLKVGGLGSFGKHDRPRVLWAGVEKNEGLSNLQQSVEACCKLHGFKEEGRPYQPHITLAKKWDGGNDAVFDPALKTKFMDEMHSVKVETFCLYEIHPSRMPKYKAIQNYRLKGV